MRCAELRWSDIDLDEHTIRVDAAAIACAAARSASSPTTAWASVSARPCEAISPIDLLVDVWSWGKAQQQHCAALVLGLGATGREMARPEARSSSSAAVCRRSSVCRIPSSKSLLRSVKPMDSFREREVPREVRQHLERIGDGPSVARSARSSSLGPSEQPGRDLGVTLRAVTRGRERARVVT